MSSCFLFLHKPVLFEFLNSDVLSIRLGVLLLTHTSSAIRRFVTSVKSRSIKSSVVVGVFGNDKVTLSTTLFLEAL